MKTVIVPDNKRKSTFTKMRTIETTNKPNLIINIRIFMGTVRYTLIHENRGGTHDLTDNKLSS